MRRRQARHAAGEKSSIGKLNSRRAAEAGFDAHLLKPVDMERLLVVMHDLVNEQQDPAIRVTQ